jgi:hypothetical protein
MVLPGSQQAPALTEFSPAGGPLGSLQKQLLIFSRVSFYKIGALGSNYPKILAIKAPKVIFSGT